MTFQKTIACYFSTFKIVIIIFSMFSHFAYSQCVVTTVNHDFELPIVSSSGVFINQNVVPGWRTTAPDDIIEFWRNGSMGGFAYSGDQYIELNAFFASGLYQDYDSSQSTVFNYTFAHRGRVGVDKMVVKAGPPGGPYTVVTEASTGNLQWKLYSGVYEVPDNQNVTRFVFEAISTATNDKTVGNFLDAINFTSTISPPIVKGVQAICSGNSATLVASGKSNSTFNWYDKKGVLIYTGSTFVSPLLFDDTSYSVEQVSSLGCKSSLHDVIIQIAPDPVVNILGNTSICSNELTDISFTSTSSNVTYEWTVVENGVTGALSGFSGAMADSVYPLRQVLKTTSNTVGTAIYTIIPTVNGCKGKAVNVKIKVNPLPEISATPLITICSKESPKIKLVSSLEGTVLNWTVVSNSVTGGSDGTGDLIDQVLETSGSNQGSVVYSVTPSYQNCIGKTIFIKVLVNPLPVPILEDGSICINQSTGEAIKKYTLDSKLTMSEYDFEWYYNSVKIDKALANTFEVDKEGDYAVIAINKKTGCISHPTEAKVEAFLSSNSGLQLSITEIPGFSDYNSTFVVNVKGGSGKYQYQLDNGDFILSNEFNNVRPGSHIIRVVDSNGCMSGIKSFLFIWYPRFFTPNGDGYNDTWNVVGLEDQLLSDISIFDRYGKFLKRIKPTADDGWNGVFNGANLPSSDYWFTVQYIEDGVTRTIKAHFTLKR